MHKSFYYIRHGETDWNRKNIPMGQTDVELNRYGNQQAQHAASILSDVDFSAICVSPLTRALKTAEIINENRNKSMLVFDELKEACFGVQEGKTKTDTFFFNWQQGEVTIGAESFLDFVQRVEQGLDKIFKLQAPVLIVSHGAVYWAIQQILTLPPYMSALGNCIPVYIQQLEDFSWDIKACN